MSSAGTPMISNGTTSADRVGEIFSFAGTAFSKLGELTMNLQTHQEPNSTGYKWDDEDIEMFRNAVKRFGEDLCNLSETIKNKTIEQMKQNLKQKSYDEAGISPTSQSMLSKTPIGNHHMNTPAAVAARTNSGSKSSLKQTSAIAVAQQLVFDDTPAVESEMEVTG